MAFICQCGSDQCKLDKWQGQEGTALPESSARVFGARVVRGTILEWRTWRKCFHVSEPLPRVIGNRRSGLAPGPKPARPSTSVPRRLQITGVLDGGA